MRKYHNRKVTQKSEQMLLSAEQKYAKPLKVISVRLSVIVQTDLWRTVHLE